MQTISRYYLLLIHFNKDYINGMSYDVFNHYLFSHLHKLSYLFNNFYIYT